MGLPCPSARKWILVLNPPRLRPIASSSGQLFLPLQHVDGRVPPSHPQNEVPSPTDPADRPRPVIRPGSDPKRHSSANGKTGWKPWSTCRTVRVSRAKALRCVKSIGSRSRSVGDRWPDAPYGAFVEVRPVVIVPISHWISHLCSWCPIIQNRF